MPLRPLLSLLFFLLLAALVPARAGVTYTFAGGNVDGCTRNGTVYTCPALPLPNWDDKVVIGGGYTVQASGDVNFGYNHGLSMTGGATLKISGNLDIGNINPSLLQVNGANFIAGGKFSFGAQNQTIVANITAASMMLGTGSQAKVTGTINSPSKGDIAIASNTTIVGPVSGGIITTNSTVNITGDVTGTRFTLCSACTVKGNIKAPEVEVQSSSGVVTGDIEATTSLKLGHAVIINGNVTTGELTMYDTDAIINGNATVTHATLQWNDRVADTIICANGSTPGKCDCVTNNSGWPVRKIKNNDQGPYCTGKTQPQAIDHFLISHDQTASVCSPSSVTVTACANGDCSTPYSGGTAVYLQPNNQRFDIGASGTLTSTVQMKPGSVTLSLTKDTGGAAGASCRLNGTNGAASNCTVNVTDAALALKVNAGTNAFFASDESGRVALDVNALVYSAQTQACVPLFKSVKRKVAFSFAYNNPQTGTLPVVVGGVSTGAGAASTLSLDFDAQGKASTTLSYADAGQLNLTARSAETDSSATGSVLAIAAPASFKIEFPDLPAPSAKPRPKAGSTFSVKVTALNAARTPAVTPNFGKETARVLVQLASTMCIGSKNDVLLPSAPSSVAGGVQTFAPNAGNSVPMPIMKEVGSFDLQAALAGGYLGTTYRPTGNTNTGGTSACTGASGGFVPAYFQVEADSAWTRKARAAGGINQYYSGEPAIKLKLTAMNLLNSPTVNYENGGAARDVDLAALDDKAVAIPATIGQLKNAQTVPAKSFQQGVATWEAGTFQFAAKRAPLVIALRATDTDGASSSAAPSDKKEPNVQIRTGRVRIDNGYNVPGQPLEMNVNLEYWDGSYWLANIEDTDTSFPAAAFARTSTPAGTITVDRDVVPANGLRKLVLRPPAGTDPRTVDVALNLGTSAADASCNAAHPATTGANRAYLRAEDAACALALADPRARAVFGLRPTDRKRIIHMRESYR